MTTNVTLTLEQELAALRAENARLKADAVAQKAGKLTLKIGQSGTVCLYGMGRFPVALYKGQWEKLLDAAPEIRTFIAANEANLSTGKEDTRFA